MGGAEVIADVMVASSGLVEFPPWCAATWIAGLGLVAVVVATTRSTVRVRVKVVEEVMTSAFARGRSWKGAARRTSRTDRRSFDGRDVVERISCVEMRGSVGWVSGPIW